MSFLGHSLSFSALTTILLTLYNFSQICETKSNKAIEDNLDLIYSDSSHGPQTAAAHQQVVFIDHGGGAISQIRRTSFHPNPSVPSLPFRPHVDHYPNSIYDNNIPNEPYVNFPEDIPRLYDSRIGQNSPNPIEVGPQQPNLPFAPHGPRTHPVPQPIHPIPPPINQVLHQPLQHISHPIPQHFPQSIPQHFPQPIPQHFPQPIPQHFPQPIPQHFPQPIPQSTPHPIPQPIQEALPKPNPHSFSQPIRQPIETDIEDERFLIHNEIERIPKPSNQMKPARREPPVEAVQEPPVNPFFNFADGPQLFPNFDSPFDPFSPQIGPQFQRRRLTTNNNGQELNPNSVGYPSYTYYKGGGEENPALTNWPKIFKFTDGRSNLYEFEKQKKLNKIKFNSKETYFDHISRDSFLILHGGTFAQ